MRLRRDATQGSHPGLSHSAPIGAPEPGGRHRVAQGVSPGICRTVLLALIALILLACGGEGSAGQALVGVTVIDGLGNPPVPGRVVVIRDGRIAEVAAADGWQATRGVQAIEMPGRFVMPGLIDLHAHVTILPADGAAAGDVIDRAASEQVLSTLLGFGVTTVRIPAALAEGDVALRDAVAAGEVLGPRILAGADAPDRTTIFGASADRLKWLEEADFEGQEIQELIGQLAEKKIPVDLTLIAHHTKFFGDDPMHLKNPELNLAPAVSRTAWEKSTFVDDWTPEDFERARGLWPRVLELTRKMYDGGVLLAAGSDLPNPWVIPGVSLHHELRLLHDAGIPPLEVLKIATYNGAVALGLESEIGSIEPGKVADLVVLAADPTKNLHRTRAISHVFLGGHFLNPAALLE